MIKIDFILLISLLIILLFLFYYCKIELLLSLILIVIILLFKDDIINKIKKKDNSKKYIEHNRELKRVDYKDDEINLLLKKLKKYKKYNPTAYENGEKHMSIFLNYIRSLSFQKIRNPKLDFENAEYNLKKSLNHFQSITISIPENSYKNIIETGNYKNNIYGTKISKICKKLYKYCYSLLYKLSIKVDKDWENKPNILKSSINYNSENVQPISSFESDIDLY